MKKILIGLTLLASVSAMAETTVMTCKGYTLKNMGSLPDFTVSFDTSTNKAQIKVLGKTINAALVEYNSKLTHIHVTGDDETFADLKKTNETRKTLLERVANDIIKQNDLISLNPVAAKKLPQMMVEGYGDLNINTTYEMDGYYKYLMSCN